MHKVLKSYLKEFVGEYAIDDLAEDAQFERLCNYCVIAQHFPDTFELESVTTSDSDPSIDGIAVIVGDDLVTTAEDAKSAIGASGKRRSVEVHYIFIQSKRSESFDAGEMLKFGTGVVALFTQGPRTSDDVVDEFLEIHEVLSENLARMQNGRPRCSLFYVAPGAWQETNGLRQQVLTPTVSSLKALDLFHELSFEPIDREALIGLWNRSREPIEATFTVKGTVPLPAIAGVTEAYLALARADEFVDNVLSDGEGRMRASVFEQNVRAFLGDDNAVNARMRAALKEAARHDRFVMNNNGITIVSPDVKIQSDRVSVTNFQIVNGCQTSHVLFRSRGDLTDAVWVPLKVIEAEDPDVVAQLVECTNSQTEVDESQFVSIRPFAQRLENYFSASIAGGNEQDGRLYFERRTNQYADSDISKYRIFDIQKLARAFAAMFLDLPHVAYMYPTQVLKERRAQLFRPDHSEHAYHTAALALYRLELALGNQYVPRKHQSAKWHMLMLFRYLVAGPEMPRFESSKMDRYCEQLDKALAIGGKASAPPFLECAKILERVGAVTRDKRKGLPYTESLIEAAKKTKNDSPRKRIRKSGLESS